MGQFYKEHLQPVQLNRQDVNWTAQNLSYLLPDAYNALMRQKLAGGQPSCLLHFISQSYRLVRVPEVRSIS